MTLVDDQYRIDSALTTELLATLPRTWTGATFAIQRVKGGAGFTLKMAFEPLPVGQPGAAIVSDRVEELARELFQVHDRYGTDLNAATYALKNGPNGWGFELDMAYEDG
jgi:hypothetical protein